MIQFDSFQEFIEMGGYAANVWSVYAMFVVFLTINLWLPLRKKKQLLREVKRRQVVNEEMSKQAAAPSVEMEALEPLQPLMEASKPAGEGT